MHGLTLRSPYETLGFHHALLGARSEELKTGRQRNGRRSRKTLKTHELLEPDARIQRGPERETYPGCAVPANDEIQTGITACTNTTPSRTGSSR